MSAFAQQIPLDLGHRTAQGRDDFLIAPGNRDAVSWIDMWPQWPAPALIVCGPAACGKSHLAAVWRDRAQATALNPADLSRREARDLFAAGIHFTLDAIDPWIGDKDAETTLFHLYNMARENSSTLLLTMRAAPTHLEFALPDLASRLRAAPVAPIAAPDEILLSAVMVKMFADRQLPVTQDILNYVLPRMERSFVAARDLVSAIDRLALAEKKPVSIALARRVLMDQSDAAL